MNAGEFTERAVDVARVLGSDCLDHYHINQRGLNIDSYYCGKEPCATSVFYKGDAVIDWRTDPADAVPDELSEILRDLEEEASKKKAQDYY